VRAFRREFNKDPPHDDNNRRWFHQFEEAGSVSKHTRMGIPSISNEGVKDIRQTFARSPMKSPPQFAITSSRINTTRPVTKTTSVARVQQITG
jgi:hypothetical protein